MTSIAPWLSVRNSARAVDFYKSAFGAIEVFRLEGPEGSVVARLSVDGAEFWLSDESPEHSNFSPESLGATEVFPVGEEHGWRLGRVVDPFGHHWEIGRPLEE